jgi:hypothetical protein
LQYPAWDNAFGIIIFGLFCLVFGIIIFGICYLPAHADGNVNVKIDLPVLGHDELVQLGGVF